jgi:dihydrofolate reductase
MRKIIVTEFLSLDGMMSDPGDTMKWVTDNFSDKGGVYQSNLYGSIDTLLFGRTTYDLWGGYWPKTLSDPATPKRELDLAQKINRAKKVVVSHRPVTFFWENTVQLKDLTREAILELKQQPGKVIAVSGSATIVQQLTNLGLVDEYHLLVYPLIMGKGKPLFKDGGRLLQLKLIGTEDFGNGVILLRYQG